MAVANKLTGLNFIKFDLFKAQDPENGRFDVVFEINGKKLYAHKTMLNLVSDTFDAMLSDRWNSKNDEPIQIKDYSFEDFYQFITFLYSGECQLSDDNISTMTDMAEFYNVLLFKTFCEEYLSNITLTVENVFPFLDLSNKYSIMKLKNNVMNFITNNFLSLANSETFLKLNKSVVQEFFVAQKDGVNTEDLFQVVYKWTEKQVGEKRDQSRNINQNDAIKLEISDFLPHIDFGKMELYFLLQFVVPRCFIFASLDEFSNILCQTYSRTKSYNVKVTNSDGETLYGNLIPDNTVIENVKALSLSDEKSYSDALFCLWKTLCQIPSSPSPLKKREGIEWYLIYSKCGNIGVYHSELSAQHYLLAELMPENGKEFHNTFGCKIEML